MLSRTEAVVLSSRIYGEADLIVSFFTLDYGRVDLFAKSPRKLKSRFGGSLEPLTHSAIAFWGREESNLPRLTQSDIIRPFQAVRESLWLFLKASQMAELIIRFLPERDPNPKVFGLMIDTLKKMESGLKGAGGAGAPGDELTLIYFKIKLLQLTGHAPMLGSCARCGGPAAPGIKGPAAPGIKGPAAPGVKGSAGSVTPDMKGTVTPGGRASNIAGGRASFYVSHGSVLCGKCAGAVIRRAGQGAAGVAPTVELSAGAVKLYEALGGWDAGKLGRLRPSAAMMKELGGVLDAHMEYALSAPIRSRSFTENSDS